MNTTVVGGGLAGLIAAISLARQGRRVTLYEHRSELGGRAISAARNGFTLNLGPHALYRDGVTVRTLKSWNIDLSGGTPDLSADAAFVLGQDRYPIPMDLAGLARSPFLSVLDKVEFARAYSKLQNGSGTDGITAAQWLDRYAGRVRVRQAFESLFRLATYCASMESISMPALVKQTAIGANGVVYLDGGWQSMIDRLAAEARRQSVEIRLGVSPARIEPNTILAIPPDQVTALTGCPLPNLEPVHMACLDLMLESAPPDAAQLAFGLDRPYYLSMHSQWAKLAPQGACLIHVGHYLRPGEQGSRADLEAYCDVAVPGWRERLIEARYLPHLAVTHTSPSLTPRPAVDVLPLDAVYIAGDWVGPAGLLADAVTSSALAAAHRITERRAAA